MIVSTGQQTLHCKQVCIWVYNSCIYMHYSTCYSFDAFPPLQYTFLTRWVVAYRYIQARNMIKIFIPWQCCSTGLWPSSWRAFPWHQCSHCSTTCWRVGWMPASSSPSTAAQYHSGSRTSESGSRSSTPSVTWLLYPTLVLVDYGCCFTFAFGLYFIILCKNSLQLGLCIWQPQCGKRWRAIRQLQSGATCSQPPSWHQSSACDL